MAPSSARKALKPTHPFPARMAPDLVLERLGEIENCSRVLDPMAGSVVVLRHATELGHQAIGFDLDPLRCKWRVFGRRQFCRRTWGNGQLA